MRLWGYGKMAYKELLNLVLNPEYGDITDVNEGTDLVLHYGKPAGAQFPQTTITPRRRPSKLSEKEKQNALNEVRILASIQHPNVIGYKDAFFENAAGNLCIVMEHADNGDLL